MRRNSRQERFNSGAIGKIGNKAVPDAMILRQYRREFGFGRIVTAAVERQGPALARQSRGNRSANPPHPRRDERKLHLPTLIFYV